MRSQRPPDIAIGIRTSRRVRVAVLALVALLGFALGMAFQHWNQPVEAGEQAALQRVADDQGRRLLALQAEVHAAESRLTVERTAQEELSQQIRQLSAENLKLKEELAFFERLAAEDVQTAQLNIHRLEVDRDGASGGLRYRMVLGYQGERNALEFQGTYQIIVTARDKAGVDVKILLPGPKDTDARRFALNFKRVLRVDGVVSVPPDLTASQVEVRVLQGGKVRASRTVVL